MRDSYNETVIWKYQLKGSGLELPMPFGGVIRHTGVQGMMPTMWIEFRRSDTQDMKTYVLRRFQLFPTGYPIPIKDVKEYVGSFILDDGDSVFHLFELE